MSVIRERSMRGTYRAVGAVALAGWLFFSGATAAGTSQRDSYLNAARNYRAAAAVLRKRDDASSIRAAEQAERFAVQAEAEARKLGSLGTPILSGTPSAVPPPGIDATRSDVSGSVKPRPTDPDLGRPTSSPDAEAKRLRAMSDALSPEQRSRARTLSTQGKELLNKKEYGAARIRFEDALKVDPGQAETHLGLGEALSGDGKRVDALRHYALATELDPDSAGAAIALARLQSLSAGTATGAAEALFGTMGAGGTPQRDAAPIGPPACALALEGTFKSSARANHPQSVTSVGTDVWQTRDGKTTFISKEEMTTTGEVVGVRGQDLLVNYVSTYWGTRYPGTGTFRFDPTCSTFTGTWQSSSSSGTWWGSRTGGPQAVK